MCVTIVSVADPAGYIAIILRRQCFARIINTATHKKKACDWYAKAFRNTTWEAGSAPDGQMYDSYGDSPDRPGGVALLQEDLWTIWKADVSPQTDTAAFDSSVALSRYNEGRGCPPDETGSGWAVDPLETEDPENSPNTVRGWEASNDELAAVLRWDVTGGFDYIES